MTHVITALCTREGDCVEVCPVDCIIPGPTDDPKWNDLFFIDPDTCIDCGACIPVCPPEAIFPEEDVPEEYEDDIARNAAYFSEGPGYWDYDLEAERNTYKGEPKGAYPEVTQPPAVETSLDLSKSADVIYSDFSFGPAAKAKGLLQPYKVLTWDTIPEALKDPEGYWAGHYYGVITFQVNKALVQNIPRDWPDLLKPEYRGQIALAGDPRNNDPIGRETGTVKWFNPTEDYGLIGRDQGGQLYVRNSQIRDGKPRALAEGQRVKFTVTDGLEGPQAIDVVVLGGTSLWGLGKANQRGSQQNEAIYAVYAAALAVGGSLDNAMPGLLFFQKLREIGNLVPLVGTRDTLVQGKTPIILRWDYRALTDREALVDTTEVEVVIPQSGILAGVYVQAISAQALHPYAARLWLEFLYSDEGQLIKLKDFVHPIRFDDLNDQGLIPADFMAKLPTPERYDQVLFPTPDQLVTAIQLITDNWDEVVGVGSPIDRIDTNIKYRDTHEYARKEGDLIVCGISEHAQASLSDVVYVGLPEVGNRLNQGDIFGEVESVKAASDLYMPMSGEIFEVNTQLENEPELVNRDPYGEGWIIKFKPSNLVEWDSLLSLADYEVLIKGE